MLSMFSQLLNVDEDIKAFATPLFKHYDKKNLKTVQIKVVGSSIVNISDFVIALAPDVFKETMQNGKMATRRIR